MPDLSDTTAQILKQATETAGAAKDFILAQAPDICREYCQLAIINGCITLAIALVVTFVLITLLGALLYKARKSNWAENQVMALVFSSSVSLMILLPTWDISLKNSIKDGITAYVAPKVYLIQTAANLLKH